MAPAAQVGGRVRIRLWALFLLLFALPTQAATYYVTVAGLGGEPDYDQRFTGLAKDLDKLLKASSPEAHVYTLMGADSNSRPPDGHIEFGRA